MRFKAPKELGDIVIYLCLVNITTGLETETPERVWAKPFVFHFGFRFFIRRYSECSGSDCSRKPVHHVAEKPDHALDEHPQAKTDFHPFAGSGVQGGGAGAGRAVPGRGCAAFEKFHKTNSIPQKAERKLNQFTTQPTGGPT